MTGCITAWYGNCLASDRKALQYVRPSTSLGLSSLLSRTSIPGGVGGRPSTSLWPSSLLSRTSIPGGVRGRPSTSLWPSSLLSRTSIPGGVRGRPSTSLGLSSLLSRTSIPGSVRGQRLQPPMSKTVLSAKARGLCRQPCCSPQNRAQSLGNATLA
jgi:hypothetical protein